MGRAKEILSKLFNKFEENLELLILTYHVSIIG